MISWHHWDWKPRVDEVSYASKSQSSFIHYSCKSILAHNTIQYLVRHLRRMLASTQNTNRQGLASISNTIGIQTCDPRDQRINHVKPATIPNSREARDNPIHRLDDIVAPRVSLRYVSRHQEEEKQWDNWDCQNARITVLSLQFSV